MSPETRIAIQLASWSAAFWVGLAGFGRCSGGRAVPRQALALAIGAGAAWLGGALVAADGGPSALFVPLGVLLVAPLRAPARQAFLSASLRALPPALAVARVGCLAGGCCGAPVAPLLGVASLVALAGLAERLPDAWVPPVVLAGLAATRAASEPLRSVSPAFSPAVLATAFVVAAAAPWARAAGPHPARSRIRHERTRVEGCRGFDPGIAAGGARGRDVPAAAAAGTAAGLRRVPRAGRGVRARGHLRRGG